MAGSITTSQPAIGTGPLLNVAEFVIAGNALDHATALELLTIGDSRVYDLMYAALLVKREFQGDALHRCSIVNAKSGACAEDCSFCGQSASYQKESEVETWPLLGAEAIFKAADRAVGNGSSHFGIVTAMKGLPRGKMLDQVCEAVRRIRDAGRILPDASLGVMDRPGLQQLKDAGLEVYHHNLECARSYYPKICSTREWSENYETVQAAKEVGLEVCCGGILGMGEDDAQRIELMLDVAGLKPQHIPLNFLVPVKGTPLQDLKPIRPLDCLKAVAVFRLTNPHSDIFIAGGRIQHLRQLQPFIFMAGANGMMVGNYLTTDGRTQEDDLELVEDLGVAGLDDSITR